MPSRMRAIAASVLLVCGSAPAFADGIYKDRERFDERAIVTTKKTHVCSRRPARLTDATPDYVGSTMGLGKPSYYGTRRPDLVW
jgi:hypothetical protein